MGGKFQARGGPKKCEFIHGLSCNSTQKKGSICKRRSPKKNGTGSEKNNAGALSQANNSRSPHVRKYVDPQRSPGVADEVGVQLAVGQGPDLDQLVPPGGHDDGGGRRRRETHARHPLGVTLLSRTSRHSRCQTIVGSL